jgi:hypothetical protein
VELAIIFAESAETIPRPATLLTRQLIAVAFVAVYLVLTRRYMQRQKCIVVENAVELSNGEKRRTDEKIE